MPLGETIVGPATGVGQSAIAMVRLSGPLCAEIMSNCFGLDKAEPRVAKFGRYRDLSGDVVDEVVFTYYKDKGSYTGEDLLEICCHGNPLIISKLNADLIARGCRMADGGEFTRTAYLNGKMDLSQAEAVCDLITAKSERGLQVAQRQLGGALGEKIGEYIERLLQVMAEVEAYIDFPEDDLPEEDKGRLKEAMEGLVKDFEGLMATNRYKEVLQDGVKTVILGAPNAGKSSLLNTLMGEERALVSAEPGTTRDFIAERIMMGPYCIRIMDTAGLRDEAGSAVEAAGIGKTVELVKQADLKIVVMDASAPYPTLPEEVMTELEGSNTIVLENKMDLGRNGNDGEWLKGCLRSEVSLKTGEGVGGFRKSLEEIIKSKVDTGGDEELVIGARHAGALAEAKKCILEGMEKMLRGEGAEFVAMDLRVGMDALGEIVGKIDNERMLDKLFSTFCIGK